MQRYIEQLIEDIHQATLKVKPPHDLWIEAEADPDDELELEDMSYVEKYVYGKEEPIGTITGIDPMLLPKPEKLTQEQQALLAVELEKLLQFYHFDLLFPEDLPAHLRYPFIINFWNEEHVAMSFGFSEFEFCDYEEEKCPFPGYCNTCKEVAEQLKYDEEHFGNVVSNFDFENILPTPAEIEAWMKQQKKNDGIANDENDDDDSFPFGDFDDDDPFIQEYNGFYNDDGTKVDPASVPVPGLCVICRKYQIDDWEEKMLCLMNRSDQRNETNFECGAFEKF
jgi:hypothetical protein